MFEPEPFFATQYVSPFPWSNQMCLPGPCDSKPQVVYVKATVIQVGDCRRELALEIEQPGCNARVLVERKNVFRMKTKKELEAYEAD